MKKILITLVMIMASLGAMNAADLTANEKNNCNNIVLEKWKSMDNITITGIVTASYNKANLESIKIGPDGMLTIIGKMSIKGSQLDIYQINFFASNVTIKYTSKTDKKTGTTAVTKVMLVKSASALGGLKLPF